MSERDDKFLRDLPWEEALKLQSRDGERWEPVFPEDIWVEAESASDFCPNARTPLLYTSDEGRCFNRRTHKIIEPWTHPRGFLMVSLYGKKISVHKLTGLKFLEIEKWMNEYIEDGEITTYHIDDNKANNKADNLRWTLSCNAVNLGRVIMFNHPDADVRIPDFDFSAKPVVDDFYDSHGKPIDN